jgi:hypothetical protein
VSESSLPKLAEFQQSKSNGGLDEHPNLRRQLENDLDEREFILQQSKMNFKVWRWPTAGYEKALEKFL